MTDALTPDEASPIAGVPVEQLKRWAWDRVGPKNIGNRYKPKYLEEDLRKWLTAKEEVYTGCPFTLRKCEKGCGPRRMACVQP